MDADTLAMLIRREVLRIAEAPELKPIDRMALQRVELAVQALHHRLAVVPQLHEVAGDGLAQLAGAARSLGWPTPDHGGDRLARTDGPDWRDGLRAVEDALWPVVDAMRDRPEGVAAMTAPILDRAIAVDAAIDDFSRDAESTASSRFAAIRAARPPDASRSGAASLEDRLTAYLRSRYPRAEDLRVAHARTVSFGSKDTVVCDIESRGAPEKLVFRFDLAVSVTGTSVTEEFEVLRFVEAAGLPVPRALWLERNAEGFAGQPFLVVEFVAGSVGTFDINVDAAAESVCRQLAEFAGRLHSLRPPFPGGAPWRTGGHDAMLRHFHGWWRSLEHEPGLKMEIAFDWLFRNARVMRGPSVLIHGDLNHRNMLLVDNELSAVVDWETWRIGHPAEDLAYCRPTVLASSVPWDRFMAWYRAAGGTDVSEEALTYCAVWGSIRNRIYSTVAEREFLAGRTDTPFLAFGGVVDVPRHETSAMRLIRAHARAAELPTA